MAANLKEAVGDKLGAEALRALARANLDKELFDYVEWAGTYEPDALRDSAMEFVDGAAGTIYDDDAYRLCKENPDLADALAAEAWDGADGWRSMPLDKLTTLACYILESQTCRMVTREEDALERLAELSDLDGEVAAGGWSLDGAEADEDALARVSAALGSAVADMDADAARAVLESVEDALGGGKHLTLAAYEENA